MSSSSSSAVSSPARSVPPSTAPSSPIPSEFSTYFLVAHQPSAAFLDALPAKKNSRDRVLLFSGTGSVNALLVQASTLLADVTSLQEFRWERVVADDEGKEVVYWMTTTDDVKECDPGLDLAYLDVQSAHVPLSDAFNLFTDASLRLIISLTDPSSSLILHILERPSLVLPRLSTSTNPYTLPSLSSFREVWALWDHVTLGMIPKSMLHTKPISLRHIPLFYIGHLPTFLNLLLTTHLGEQPIGPQRLPAIFERGIDPHVDDPGMCHKHSEVPEREEDWPKLGEVLAYRDRVRDRLERLFEELETGKQVLTRRLARALMMIHEHDGFHIETLLYMLIQRAGCASGTLPPPGFTIPPWAVLAEQWDALPAPSTPSVSLGPCTLTMGMYDPEPADLDSALATHDVLSHEFGWDNESPRRQVEVGKFKAEWRPITNGEFLAFWQGEGKDIVKMPASWVEEDGEVKVRTLYGPVSMTYARHWPVLTSYDDLAAFARSKGGRIPTEPELRLFLDKYQVGYEEGANIGFRNWHPMPATAGCEKDGGRGSNGGVWEWTSTPFDTHEGFIGTTIFPGYSSDFFDGVHHVVLGASYATIPRLADRRTVRNFYQHNYPYAWVGARVVYDL